MRHRSALTCGGEHRRSLAVAVGRHLQGLRSLLVLWSLKEWEQEQQMLMTEEYEKYKENQR